MGKYEIMVESGKEKKISEIFEKEGAKKGPQTYEFKGQAPSLREVKRELE